MSPKTKRGPAADITVETPDGIVKGYAPGEERPLGSYAVLTGIYGGGVGAAVFALSRTRRDVPADVSLKDVLLIGTATHKLSRLIAKDKVTSVFRAPFTRYEGPAGPGELSESPRGTGVRLAVGELLGCPYCLGQWVATALTLGFVAAPRQTRIAASIFTALTVSDFLQLAYKAAEDKAL